MAWNTDWWSVLGWAGFGAGLIVALWALYWDRARGRLRCPKCWYDMSAAAPGSEDGDTDTGARGFLSKCPECGRRVKRERELKRTRRRWRWGIPAVVVMVIGLIAGAVHDPAGVRSRGWVALVPTTVLVMIAPVRDVVVRQQHTPSGFAWNSDPTDPFLGEIGFRITTGRISISEARWWFKRVEKANPALSEHVIALGLPRYIGGDLHIWTWFNILHAYRGAPWNSLKLVGLPSRERLVGGVPGQWVYRCECSLNSRLGTLIGAALEPGRYIIEREFYLPDPWPYSTANHPRLTGEELYSPDRLVWRARREVVISESTINLMHPFDASGVGDELVRQLDPVIGIDGHNRIWYLTKPLVDSLTERWRGIAFGMSVRILKDGAEVGTGTIHASNPNPATRQPDPSGWDNLYNMHSNSLRNDGALAVGDLVTVVLEGTVEIAGSHPNTPAEFWSGTVVLEEVIVQGVPGVLPVATVRWTPLRSERVTVPPMEE